MNHSFKLSGKKIDNIEAAGQKSDPVKPSSLTFFSGLNVGYKVNFDERLVLHKQYPN